jgi:trk system potassium uptake protein TrkH
MLIRSPNAVFVPRFQGVRITESTTNSVLVFFFIFFASMVVLAALLHMTGLDFITSISGAATALANIGPGFGEVIGPSGNFAPLNDTAKVLLILGMWLGRLELMAVFVLLTRRFWRG